MAKPTPPTTEDVPSDRWSAKIDPEARSANIIQLRRARGQVDGIERMILSDRYCADIITQIAAARASLQVVARSLLDSHLRACQRAAGKQGERELERMHEELIKLVEQMLKRF